MRHGSTPNLRAGRARVLWAAVAVWAATQAGDARAAGASGNVIQAIEVQDAEEATEIRVRGSAEPTFTVFKLAEPPRLVVDLAAADVSGMDRLLEVGRGNVKAVLTNQFSDTSAQVGRVTVALQADGAYDVRAEGNDVVVTVSDVAGALADAAPMPPAVEVASDEPEDASLPPGVVARKVDRLQTGLRPGDRLERVTAVSADGSTRLTFASDGPPMVVETLELVDPPRLAVDLYGLTAAPRRADTRRVSRDSVLRGVRIGRHAEKVRVVLDLDPRSEPDWRLERIENGAVLTLAHPEGVAQVAAADESRIQAISYARRGDVGRASLAIDGGEAPGWHLERPDDRTAVLTLDGARLDPSLARTLDAAAQGGAVRSLTASSEAPGHVKVVATLARPVPSRIVSTNVGLNWEFDFSEAPQATAVAAAAGVSSEGAVHVASSAEAQRYTGRRMTLDFKNIDIHNVLRLIAEVSRRNIVVADDVRGQVTLKLANVPWDQALDLVLQSKGLDKEVRGNIIRVAPAERIAQERQQRLEAQQASEQLEPLRVRIIPVNFATAGDVSSQVQSVLTERGSITIDSRTNSLIVKDIAAALERAQQLAQRLDTETPQVAIESRIVEANSNFTREVGIQWGGNISMSPITGNPTGLVFPNVVTVNGAATDGQTPTEGTAGSPNFVVNMPAPIGTNSGGGLGFVFGSVGGAANLNLRLSALENEGVVKTISAPKVTTMDNEQASISSGLSIPFSQVSAAGVNTTFIEARLQLDVTPHVTADGSVLMEIAVTNNQPNPQLTGANGQPSISKKEARTSVIVKDGETTVIGGIYTRQHSEAVNAVPWFSKIPVLGWLFKKKNVQEQRTELLVFITPRIINRSRSIPAGASLN